MDKTKIVVVVVVGAVALAAAWGGFCWFRDYRCACADRRATECLRAYSRIVGDGMKPVSAERLGPVMEEMAALSGRCSADVAECLFARRLDGAFLVGDYALAEKMMDDMPGRSANWKAGAKAKIRAHAALARGDKTAAIGEFEAFCASLLKEDPNLVEFDPCSDSEWSREGLLARNLKRMGELAAETGDRERSAKFLSEAREYAQIALQKAEGDEATIKAMLDDFGSLLK